MIVVWIIFIGSIWLADVPSRWREWKEWRDINERNAKYDAMWKEQDAQRIAKQLADNQSENKQSDRIETAKQHVKAIAKRCGDDITIVGRAYEHEEQSGTDWILKGCYAMTSDLAVGKSQTMTLS